MAAGDSPLSICNLGLLAIGEDPMVSFDPPDNTKRAILANTLYDPVRRQILRSHPWGCAKRQAQLAASTTAPPFTYAFAYPVPADWLRMFDAPDNDPAGKWGHPREMMNLAGIGNCIVTNAGPPFNILYVFDLVDCTQMDADLVMAIGAGLADRLAIPLAVDLQLKSAAQSEREGILATARTISAQERSSPEMDIDVLLRSRW